MYPAIAGDPQLGIPEHAFLVPELIGDGPQRTFAFGNTAVIAWAGEPEVQLQWVGCVGRLAKRHQAEHNAKRRGKGGFFQQRK